MKGHRGTRPSPVGFSQIAVSAVRDSLMQATTKHPSCLSETHWGFSTNDIHEGAEEPRMDTNELIDELSLL